MRLLDTRTLELQEFHSPPDHYAILSHTWGAEEVTYQHLLAGTEPRRQGWKKLEGACRVAANDGWDLLWMDTCCIDKTNNVELSEAINSMYKWYQASSICYAYLEDVEVVNGEPVSSYHPLLHNAWDFSKLSSRQDFQQLFGDFQKPLRSHSRTPRLLQGILSRWFTRGWTLQELLAPRVLLFLDKNWCDIGGRTRWSAQIEAITSIDQRYFLRQDSIHEEAKCPAAIKFAWASLRDTSRPEDQVYCLLGLLNVNMPLLYGEGAHNAFHRLQRKIIKHSDDDSILAWQLPRSASMEWDNVLAPELGFFRWLTDFRHHGSKHRLYLKASNASRDEFTMTNKGLKTTVPLSKVLIHRRAGLEVDSVKFSDGPLETQIHAHHLQLNCWLQSLEDPSRSLAIAISVMRHPRIKNVFIRNRQLVCPQMSSGEHEKKGEFTYKVSDPSIIYLKHEHSMRYSRERSIREHPIHSFSIEAYGGIKIRSLYAFNRADGSVTPRDLQPMYTAMSRFGYRLTARECLFINARKGDFTFLALLGLLDSSPWTPWVTLAEWHHFRLGHGQSGDAAVDNWHIWDVNLCTGEEPGAYVDRMSSAGASLEDQATLVNEKGGASIIARVQPCQLRDDFRVAPLPDASYLLRITAQVADPASSKSPPKRAFFDVGTLHKNS